MSVVIVAAAVMFFAVSASAFALRAKAMSNHCHKNHIDLPVAVERTPPPVPVTPAVKPAVIDTECGQAVRTYEGNGKIKIQFNACDPEQPLVDAAMPAGLVP